MYADAWVTGYVHSVYKLCTVSTDYTYTRIHVCACAYLHILRVYVAKTHTRISSTVCRHRAPQIDAAC